MRTPRKVGRCWNQFAKISSGLDLGEVNFRFVLQMERVGADYSPAGGLTYLNLCCPVGNSEFALVVAAP
jgi:hypothetical protein